MNIQQLSNKTFELSELQKEINHLKQLNLTTFDPQVLDQLEVRFERGTELQMHVKQFLEEISNNSLNEDILQATKPFILESQELKITFPELSIIQNLDKNAKLEKQFYEFRNDENRHTMSELQNLMEQFKKLKFTSFCLQELQNAIEEGEKLNRYFGDAQKAGDFQQISNIIQSYQSQKVLNTEIERMMVRYKKNQEEFTQIETDIADIRSFTYDQMHQTCKKLDSLNEHYFDTARINQVRKTLYINKVKMFKAAWERRDLTQEISLRGIKDWLNEGVMLCEIYPSDHEIYQNQQWINQVVKQVQKRIEQIKRIKSLEQLEQLEKDRHLEGLVDFSEELIEHKTAIEMLKFGKFQDSQEQNVNTESTIIQHQSTFNRGFRNDQDELQQKLIDPIITSLENFKRQCRRQYKKNDMRERRQLATKLRKEDRILNKNNYLSSAGELTEEDPEIVYDRTFIHSKPIQTQKKNIMTVLQSAILGNKQWRLKPMDAVEFAIGLAEIVRGQGPVQAEAMVKFMQRLQKLAGLSSKIQEDNFSIETIADFYLKGPHQLEMEEKKAIAQQFSTIQQVNEARKQHLKEDYTIKRKLKTHLNLAQLSQTLQPTSTTQVQAQLKQAINQQLIPSTSTLKQGQQKQSQSHSIFSQVSHYLKNNQLMQSVFQDKNLLQQFRVQNGTLNKRKPYEQTSPAMSDLNQTQEEQINEGEFSEDEAGGQLFKDIEPIREEETEEFLLFLSKLAGIKQVTDRKILFDPDAEQATQDASQSSQVNQNQNLLPLKGSQLRVWEGTLKGLSSQNVLVCFQTGEAIQTVQKFPQPLHASTSQVKLEYKMNLDKFDEYITKLTTTKKKKRVFGGKIEASIQQQKQTLDEGFEDLRTSDHIGCIQWTKNCKTFLIHNEQMKENWKKIINYVTPLITNSLAENNIIVNEYYFVMVYNYGNEDQALLTKMLQPTVIRGIYPENETQQKAQDNTLPPFQEEETTTLQELYIQQQIIADQQQYFQQQTRKYNPCLLLQMSNPGVYAENLKEFSKELHNIINKQLQQQNPHERARSESMTRVRSGSSGRVLKSKMLQQALNSMINKKTYFEKIGGATRKYTENETIYQMKSASKQRSNSKPTQKRPSMSQDRPMSFRERRSISKSQPRERSASVQRNSNVQTTQSYQENQKIPTFKERVRERSRSRSITRDEQSSQNQQIPSFQQRKEERRSRSRSVTRDAQITTETEQNRPMTFKERSRSRSQSALRKSQSIARPRGISVLKNFRQPIEEKVQEELYSRHSASNRNEFVEDLQGDGNYLSQMEQEQNDQEQPYNPTLNNSQNQNALNQSTITNLLNTINESLQKLLQQPQNNGPIQQIILLKGQFQYMPEEFRDRSMSQFRGPSQFNQREKSLSQQNRISQEQQTNPSYYDYVKYSQKIIQNIKRYREEIALIIEWFLNKTKQFKQKESFHELTQKFRQGEQRLCIYQQRRNGRQKI